MANSLDPEDLLGAEQWAYFQSQDDSHLDDDEPWSDGSSDEEFFRGHRHEAEEDDGILDDPSFPSPSSSGDSTLSSSPHYDSKTFGLIWTIIEATPSLQNHPRRHEIATLARRYAHSLEVTVSMDDEDQGYDVLPLLALLVVQSTVELSATDVFNIIITKYPRDWGRRFTDYEDELRIEVAAACGVDIKLIFAAARDLWD